MLLVGLTGGIGSGKSSVSQRLVSKGAALIDADALVRELQEPGQPVLLAMVEHFGPQILNPDGALDRAAVAAVVFSDADQRAELERIVHPVLGAEIRRRIDTYAISAASSAASSDADSAAGPGRVVVLDHPLLIEKGSSQGHSVTVVVDCPTEIAVQRLVEFRNFTEADARARIAAQTSRKDRLAKADWVVDNSASADALDGEVERCWEFLLSQPPTQWPPDEASRRSGD